MKFTVIYQCYVGNGHYIQEVCRVFADSEESAHKVVSILGDVLFIIDGHPEILSHKSENIRTYDSEDVIM